MEINTTVSNNWIKNSYRDFGLNLNADFTGPTASSNWLIPNKLLVGGYPDTKADIQAIENAGITTFVCLNDEYGRNDLHRPFPAYETTLSCAKFVHFPMKDMSAHKNDKELLAFCNQIATLITSGNTVFIHCSGGHGRTGVVAGIVLHLLTGHNADVLFDYMQYAHDQRKCHKFGYKFFAQHLPEDVKNYFVMGQVPTPQIAHQRYQVYRCIIEIMKQMS